MPTSPSRPSTHRHPEAAQQRSQLHVQVDLLRRDAAAQILAPYRDDVLNSLAALHRRLAHAPSAAEQPDAAAEPLGAALAGHPRAPVSELAPTERAERPLGGALGHAWRATAVQALLLAETPAHLRHRLGADTPRGAVSAMAGLAAAVEAFAVAETDLFALATRSRLAHRTETPLTARATSFTDPLAGANARAGVP